MRGHSSKLTMSSVVSAARRGQGTWRQQKANLFLDAAVREHAATNIFVGEVDLEAPGGVLDHPDGEQGHLRQRLAAAGMSHEARTSNNRAGQPGPGDGRGRVAFERENSGGHWGQRDERRHSAHGCAGSNSGCTSACHERHRRAPTRGSLNKLLKTRSEPSECEAVVVFG
jgi:hypothetical protein